MSTRVRKTALTIGVSDSSGGAGIQGDLKAFSGMGVHGTTVISGITAQNTRGVQAAHPLSTTHIREQLASILADLPPAATKTGLLLTAKIVAAVAKQLGRSESPLVVDPEITGTYGVPLVGEDFVPALRTALVPMATVVTPNLHEASVLVGWKVTHLDDMVRAAEEIHQLGCRAVLVTGGHLPGREAIDVYYDGEVRLFKEARFEAQLLGSGGTLSALITALLAKGRNTQDACRIGKELITQYIRHGYDIGEGMDVVDSFATLFNEAEKYRVLQEVRAGLRRLERALPVALVPAMGANLGFGLPHVNGPADICALEGKMIATGRKILTAGIADFSSSDPITATVSAVMSFDHRYRCALRIAAREGVLEAAKALNFWVGTFDHGALGGPTRDTESLGVRTAIEALGGSVPDLIAESGAPNQESTIRLLGNSPKDVIQKLTMLAGELDG